VQRLLAGGIDILLVVGISGFLPISLVGRLTCAGLVLLVFIVVQSLTGVGPGGAVMGMRLHRVARGGWWGTRPVPASIPSAFLV